MYIIFKHNTKDKIHEKKNDKLDFIKLKILLCKKAVSREWKENTSHRLREKYLQKHMW